MSKYLCFVSSDNGKSIDCSCVRVCISNGVKSSRYWWFTWIKWINNWIWMFWRHLCPFVQTNKHTASTKPNWSHHSMVDWPTTIKLTGKRSSDTMHETMTCLTIFCNHQPMPEHKHTQKLPFQMICWACKFHMWWETNTAFVCGESVPYIFGI